MGLQIFYLISSTLCLYFSSTLILKGTNDVKISHNYLFGTFHTIGKLYAIDNANITIMVLPKTVVLCIFSPHSPHPFFLKLYFILSLCLFNLYAEYIMWNARLDEAQAGIKIAGRNINNLRYTDDTTLMAESEEELRSLLMRVKKLAENSTFRKLRSWHRV